MLRATGGANLFVFALTAYGPAPLPMPLDRSKVRAGPVSCKLKTGLAAQWFGRASIVVMSKHSSNAECQAVPAISLQHLSSTSRGPDRPCMLWAMELLISCRII